MAPPAAPQLQPQLQRVSSAAGVPAAGSPRHSRANSSSSAAVEADSGGQAFKEQVRASAASALCGRWQGAVQQCSTSVLCQSA